MSKYGNLMDYLDAQELDTCTDGLNNLLQQPSPPPPQYYSSSNLDPRSSMKSPFPSSSSNSSFSSRKQYIWDETDEESFSKVSNSHVSTSATAPSSSHRREYEQGGETDESGLASVSDMVQAVREKVNLMKIELRERSDAVRDSQAELARLRKARERRTEKCERLWEDRVRGLKEEQSKILIRQKKFFERLSDDTKVLAAKDGALREKSIQSQSVAAAAERKAQVEGQKRRDRARQQGIADEKTSFEKVGNMITFYQSMKSYTSCELFSSVDSFWHCS